jgi:flagellar biosynthesis/type III secretory pathway chaperone
MIVANPVVESLLPELLSLLDQHAVTLGERLTQMKQLSAYTLERRPDQPMDALLDRMEQASHTQGSADTRLAAMRATLARAIGVEPTAFRLSQLEAVLSPRDAAALRLRREQVLLLAQRLRSEHLHAAVLLNEAARVNRMMLDALLGGAGVGVATYGPDGDKRYDASHGLVNAER